MMFAKVRYDSMPNKEAV